MSQLLLDRAGRRRSPATLPGFHVGQSPGNKGHRYPADPPKVEEIVAVMRAAGDRPHGRRMRALIVILWRVVLPFLQEAFMPRYRRNWRTGQWSPDNVNTDRLLLCRVHPRPKARHDGLVA